MGDALQLDSVVLESTVIERASALWAYHKLDLGVEGIDAQHAWLVCMVMQLEWLLHHDFEHHKGQIDIIGRHVKTYVAEHFSTEEQLFSELHYSYEAAHKKGHAKFTLTLERLLQSGSLQTRENAEKLYRLIRSWLVHHILTEDKGYAGYFVKRKLLGDANATFERLNKEQKLVDDERLALLKKVRSGILPDVTTPEIVQSIRSTWSRMNLQIGVPIIDIQHLWLIKMIVDMDEALRESHLTRQAVLARTIDEAERYIAIHFRTEEKLMSVIGYNNTDGHRSSHKKFEEFVKLRKLNLENGDLRAALTIVQDLRSWLVNHIAMEDRTLISFYRDKRDAALTFSKDEILSGRAGIYQAQINIYKLITSSS